jgi:cytochrome c-type biogenesis protein CcmH
MSDLIFELWMGVALLLLIAAGFLAIPYLINLRRGSLLRESTNVTIYKSQLADLEADKQAQRVSDEDYQSLSQEIKRNLLADTDKQNKQKQDTDHEGGRWIVFVMAACVLVSSIALYGNLGAENEVAIAELLKKSESQGYSKNDAEELLERLMVETTKTPEDVEVWYLIGRLNFDLGNYNEAVLGFNGVLQYLPKDAKQDQAVAMAQLAQAQFFANGRKLDKATQSLLKDALEINPKDNTSLGLLGVASYDRGDYLNAVKYWTRLMALMPPNNPNARAIKGGLDKAKSQLTKAQLAGFEQEQLKIQEAKIKSRIQVTVNISDKMKGKLPKNADLFVLAKADQGPPMPLAVQRLTVSKWPITVTLDDSMAMMESLRMSQFKNIIITARISKSGVGNAKPGDLEGGSTVMSSTAKNVSISINKEL